MANSILNPKSLGAKPLAKPSMLNKPIKPQKFKPPKKANVGRPGKP